MIAIPTFATVASSLKEAAAAAKAMIELRDSAAFRAQANELHSKIASALADSISAYESQALQMRRLDELEAEIRALKTWETEKQRYQLERLPPGVFVYTLKPSAGDGEPVHSICQTCYQRGKKSILHSDECHNGVNNLNCAECGSTLQVGIYQQPQSHFIHEDDYPRGGGDDWMR